LGVDDLRKQLENVLPGSHEVVVISAYITVPGIDWLITLVNLKNIKLTIVARASVMDIVNGSTDLDALSKAIDAGWEVKCLSNLHAKIILVDKKEMYVGSANLTGNGLKLVGKGNLEATIKIPSDPTAVSFVNKVVEISTPLTKDIINKMAFHVKSDSSKHGVDPSWPEDILLETPCLQVNDFPLTKPRNGSELDPGTPDLLFSRIECIADYNARKDLFLGSKAYRWLLNLLNSSEENCVYYGYGTSVLHNVLIDDPSPYRRNVKQLFSNLLDYIELYASEYINISRPNHSQLICLEKNDG